MKTVSPAVFHQRKAAPQILFYMPRFFLFGKPCHSLLLVLMLEQNYYTLTRPKKVGFI